MLMEGLKASGCHDIFKSDYLKRLLALAKSFPSLYYSNLNIVMWIKGLTHITAPHSLRCRDESFPFQALTTLAGFSKQIACQMNTVWRERQEDACGLVNTNVFVETAGNMFVGVAVLVSSN